MIEMMSIKDWVAFYLMNNPAYCRTRKNKHNEHVERGVAIAAALRIHSVAVCMAYLHKRPYNPEALAEYHPELAGITPACSNCGGKIKGECPVCQHKALCEDCSARWPDDAGMEICANCRYLLSQTGITPEMLKGQARNAQALHRSAELLNRMKESLQFSEPAKDLGDGREVVVSTQMLYARRSVRAKDAPLTAES